MQLWGMASIKTPQNPGLELKMIGNQLV